MMRSIYIALLEIKRYLKDRGDIAFSIALPIVLFALTYGAFSGEERFNATAHVVNLDQGPEAARFIERFEAMEGVTVRLRSQDEAMSALDRSNILTLFLIPEGFSSSLQAGEPINVKVLQRGAGGQEGQVLVSIAQGVVQEMGAEKRLKSAIDDAIAESGGDVPGGTQALVDRFTTQAREQPAVRVRAELIGGDGSILNRMIPGIVVMFLLFAVMLNAAALVEERMSGTLERLMTTSLTVNQLFAGKFLAGSLRGTIQAAILMTLAFAVLRVGGVEEYLEVLVFVTLTAAAVGSVGLAIAAVARNREQATWPSVFVTLFMTVFGGTFFEVGSDGIVGLLSRLTLNKYAIDAIAGLLGGGTLGDYVFEMLVMVGVMIAALILARSLFRVAQHGR